MNEDWLRPVLSYLDGASILEECSWQGWTILPVSGGANNLIYRLRGYGRDCALKFTIRDVRRRAWREYQALALLELSGFDLAPRPMALDETSYRQPLVVQSWLAGRILDGPPQLDEDWEGMAAHYAAIHSLRGADHPAVLEPAVLNILNCESGIRLVFEHAGRIPLECQPHSLQNLLKKLAAWASPSWPEPTLVLCRSDPNWRNFIWGNRDCQSVDWENSGWGDAAFEIADLLTHPAYEYVSEERKEQFVRQYAARSPDPEIRIRVQGLCVILYAWWVARLARYLYEIPRGLDNRLVAQSPGWQEEMQAKYDRYLQRSLSSLDPE